MDVLVPVDPTDPKTRLQALFDLEERRELIWVMLDAVTDAIDRSGHDPVVLSTTELDIEDTLRVDKTPLSTAVNAALADLGFPVGVVMADCPLVTPPLLQRFFESSGDVVIAPGRGGGTNALVVRHSAFRVDYHGHSLADHRRIAHEGGCTLREFDSHRLSADVDDPADLVEVLLHGDGPVRDWLVSKGVALDDTTPGTVRRDE